jgi:Flp pilus assembly protein TadG
MVIGSRQGHAERPMGPPRAVTRRTGATWRGDQAGVATLFLPLLVWIATVAAIVVVDVGAYLVAASRAQQLADAAALAAVSGDVRGPRGAAGRVVAAGAGSLDRCDCVAGQPAEVVVSVAVPGLVIPSLGARRVAAVARAEVIMR